MKKTEVLFMAESYVQKMRPLLILEYLQKNSHCTKPVRTPELLAYLEETTGISCDRKTVYSDIRALIECNYDICALPGRYGGYYKKKKLLKLQEFLLVTTLKSAN